MVIGERRNYLVALLPLDPDKLHGLAKSRGFSTDPAVLAHDAGFRAYLEGEIEAQVNPKLSRFETIKRFAVLPQDFSVAGGELTPTLKVKRSVVEKKFAGLIEELYEEKPSARVG